MAPEENSDDQRYYYNLSSGDQCQRHGGAGGKVRGSLKSVGLILWGP